MNKSLLPVNVTPLELDLEQVISRCTDLPVHIKDLWNPETCPFSLLPWLAWALSVDTWDERWPEHIKRQVVRDSFDIHRLKGTPYAVRKALDSLNIKMQLREWWEPGANQQPGTMSAVALINENLTDNQDGLITKTMLEQVVRAIESAKRGVIHFDVELAVISDESLGISGAVGTSFNYSDQTIGMIPVVPNSLAAEVGLSAGFFTVEKQEREGSFTALVPGIIKASPQLSMVFWRQCLSDFDFIGAT
jgi:phage tail P2-like protein